MASCSLIAVMASHAGSPRICRRSEDLGPPAWRERHAISTCSICDAYANAHAAIQMQPCRDRADIWPVVPDDEGAFKAAQRASGADRVHPVQAHLDLRWLPDRAPVAASGVRRRLLASADRPWAVDRRTTRLHTVGSRARHMMTAPTVLDG